MQYVHQKMSTKMLQHAPVYAIRQGASYLRLSAASTRITTSAQTRQRISSSSLRPLSTSTTGTTSGWRGAIRPPPPPPPPDGRHASAMGWVGVAA
ncbi:unnamed protein product, partial [Laminaria digitata]